MKIRKQVYELTISDIEEFPVWEFASDEEGDDGQDEATVRPLEFNAPLDPSDGMFVVQSEFLLADGTKMQGYLSPAPKNELAYIQPIIITENGQIMFWYGIMKPLQEKITSNYSSLGKSSEQVFPLIFKSKVDILGGAIKGVIDGFSFYSQDRKVQSIK